MSTVDFDALASFVKTRKVGAVAAWCARNRVLTFRDAKGRPCTTVEALNHALYRGRDNENEPDYSWESSLADSQFPASSRKTAAITRLSAIAGSRSHASTKGSIASIERSTSSTPQGRERWER